MTMTMRAIATFLLTLALQGTSHAKDACPLDTTIRCDFNHPNGDPNLRGDWAITSFNHWDPQCTTVQQGYNAWQWVDLSRGFKGDVVYVCDHPLNSLVPLYPAYSSAAWELLDEWQTADGTECDGLPKLKLRRRWGSNCSGQGLSLPPEVIWWYDLDRDGVGCPTDPFHPPLLSRDKPKPGYVLPTAKWECFLYARPANYINIPTLYTGGLSSLPK